MFRQIARRARDSLFALVETIWAAAFRLARTRPSARQWSSPGHQRILVIAPHPDDEVVGCAGTLILHKRMGDFVCIVYVTDGRASRALGLAPETMARRRQQEATNAARALEVDRAEWIGLPENQWHWHELVPRLQALLTEFAPDVIYAPSRVDYHSEHFRVAHALARSLDSTPQILIRVYCIQVPLTPTLTNLIAPTDAARNQMHAAFDTYVTQRGSAARAWRARHYNAILHCGSKGVEEFWEMKVPAFVRLHETAPETWNARAFRSFRFAPFTDPLAFVEGRAERRRLKHLTFDSIRSLKTAGTDSR